MKDKKQDIIYILIIVLLVVFYVLITTNFFSYSYGSATDWDCQHWMIPDFFRKQFYETGELFSNFAPNIGDGQNIYYLSYYGYLSPIVLLSYLLPFIPMKIYIEAISVIGLLASAILFYLWMKKKYDAKLSFVVTLLFLASTPLLFHSHRHIMFTCYMPFLILALKEVDNKFIKNKAHRFNIRFIIYIFLIIMSNYFFAVSALFAISLYEFHNIFFYHKETHLTDEIKKEIINFIIEMLTAVLMASVLLLPTFAIIMLGRSKSNVDLNLLSLIIPNYNITNLFYGSYATGITLLSFVAVVRNTRSSKYNVLSILILVSLIFPIVSFFLNGTMYIDYKVLIPLIPLIIYDTAHYIKILDDKKKVYDSKYIKYGMYVIAALYILLNITRLESIALAIELIILSVILKRKDKKKCIMYYAIVISIASLIINTRTDILELNIPINHQKEINIEETKGKYNYRVSTNSNILANSNYIEDINYNIGSIYSSTSNAYYKEYYYNFGVEVSQRSLGKLTSSRNILYNIANGNRYIEDARRGLSINNEALSIGRSNMEMLSLEEYKKLEFPYNMEALYKYVIVDKKVDNTFHSDIEEYKGTIELKDKKEKITIKDNLKFTIKEPRAYSVKLNDINENDLVIISFSINEIKCPLGDRSITINKVKNTISCKEWKYHNKNNVFHYVVDNYKTKDKLKIKLSPGEYELNNIKIYTLDYNKVKENIKSIKEIDLSIDRKNNNIITGKYESDKDDIVYLQIPYDKGFNIKVNDKKVEYFTINNGMIGFNINAGLNNIEIEFNAPLLKESKILSLTGIILLIVLFIINLIRKDYQNEFRERNKNNKRKKQKSRAR